MFANDDLVHRTLGFQAGAADYLIKPPLREEVIAKISTHVKGRTSTQQTLNPEARLDRERPDVADKPPWAPNCEVCTELPLQRRYFRDIVHKLSDSIFLLEVSEDGRFRYLEANQAFEAGAGVPEDSLRGKYFEDLPRLSEDQAIAEKAIAKFRRCLETGSVIEEELILDLKSGRRIYHASLTPLFNDNGRIDRILGVSRDITDSKLAEARLMQQEREYRSLAENLPDYIARYDLNARKTYANPKLEQLLGGNIEAWIGKTPKEINPGGEYEAYQAKVEDTLRTGECDDLEHLSPDGSGGWIHFHIRFVPEREPDGKIVGVLAIGRDVTRKRRLELELIRSEREFRTLAENLPDIIVRYDKCLRRIYNNTVSDKLPDLLADDIFSESPPARRPITRPNIGEFRRMLQRVIETGIAETTLIQAEIKPGNNFYWTMNLIPEFDQDGKVAGVLTRCTDITELKEYQRELEASRSQLRALAIRGEKMREDERKRIARELHDDLGQRLTALKLDLARLQLRFGTDNPQLQQQIEEMERDLGSTIQIVRNVATQLRPSALEMGIVSALEWLVLEFRRHSHIKCRLRIPKRKIVLNDGQATAMFRIVQESLTNIMRHAMASAVEIVLAFDFQHYLLEIRDDGVGFDADRTRKAGSFGLIGIEERTLSMGGIMSIETAPNQGVKLTVRIPVLHPDEEVSCSEY